MEELMCHENMNSSSSSSSSGDAESFRKLQFRIQTLSTRRARPDPAFNNDRILQNLLNSEDRQGLITSYFETVQHTVTPHMRKILAQWMLEVCEEQKCQEEVFPLAVSYLDKFLSLCSVTQGQLQLLGSACLLLATKLREPSVKGLPVDILVFYTDNSISAQDLCKWELLVITKLEWDLCKITPLDFLPLLVSRLPLGNSIESDMVIKHAQAFVALAIRDFHFTKYTASTLASASIAVALQGLNWCSSSGISFQQLLNTLCNLLKTEHEYLCTCVEHIEYMIQETINEKDEHDPNGIAGAAPENEMDMEKNWSQPQLKQKHLNNAKTPTDVRDVHF